MHYYFQMTLELENAQLKLTWEIGELIKDTELFIGMKEELDRLQKKKCINKLRASRIEYESKDTFFTASARNLQSIFFLDDMIPSPTSELFLMSPTAPSCHR